MYRRDNLLFYEGDLHGTLDNHSRQINEKVNSVPKDQFLSTPEELLSEHIYSGHIIEPLVLHEDSMEMDQHELQIDVSGDRLRNPFGDRGPIHIQGIRITVSVPFTGDPELFKLRPNSWQSVFPRADIRKPMGETAGSIEFIFEQPSDTPPEQLKQSLEGELKSIRFYVDAQRTQVEQFNEAARDKIQKAIQSRREKLRKHDGIADYLGIPMKRRDGAPATKPIPIKRTLVRPLPPPPKSGYKPEPGITNDDYEHILSVIRHEGRTFEATPKTFAVHHEEELRDIILAHLNGHYQGGATGETFRRSGKTDIRIEDESRAAFVAECKMWKGQKELLAAVNQLLGYLSWRDCKASIVIFNKKNAKFSELLEKIPETIKNHTRFISDLYLKGEEGEWRFVLSLFWSS